MHANRILSNFPKKIEKRGRIFFLVTNRWFVSCRRTFRPEKVAAETRLERQSRLTPLLQTRYKKTGHQDRFYSIGVPRGSRTPVAAVKGRCPRPLDDGDEAVLIRDSGVAPVNSGGARRDRTDDLLHAMQALSQLSYSPTKSAHFTVAPGACQEYAITAVKP